MPRITSAPIPAGQSKPIKIPPGQKIITVENPDAGTGAIVFHVNNNPIFIYYSPAVTNPGGLFSIPVTVNHPDFPSDDNIFCFSNWDEDGKAVHVHVDDAP